MYCSARMIVFFFVTLLAVCSQSLAREWTDASGKYKFKGELVAVGNTMVIVQRDNKAKDIVAIDVEDLCQEDRDHLEELNEKNAKHPEMQTYTTRSGLKVRAAVLGYVRRKIDVYRHRGKVYANGIQFEKLPGIYRRILPQVINHFEKTRLNEETLPKWVKTLKGAKKTYECEGVLVELENGDHYTFPFFLLSKDDFDALEPGFKDWSKAKDDEKRKEEHDMRMRAQAMAQRKKVKQMQQFAKLHFVLQSVDAGFTDLWEVTLMPTNGQGIPRKVIVPGRNSGQASAAAMAKFPGYRAGPIRETSDRF